MSKSLYLTTTESDSQKKAVTLGLMEMLIRRTGKVAYFKPIIHVSEKNTVEDNFRLVKSYFNLPLHNEQMYAYTFDEAERLISGGLQDEFLEGIVKKYKELEESHSFVLCEGTDFDLLTSNFEMDLNARIASVLASPVIVSTPAANREVRNVLQAVKITVESFKSKKCDVIGTIVNRVPEQNCPQYQQVLKSEPLLSGQHLAVLPESSIIGTPTLLEIVKYLNASVLFGGDQLSRSVNNVSIGVMRLENHLWGVTDGTMIVTTGDRADLIAGSILMNQSSNFPEISALMLTSEHPVDKMILKLIEGVKYKIPILTVNEDITRTASKLDTIKPDILPENATKIQAALNLFDAYADTEALAKLIIESRASKVTPKMFEYELIHKAKMQKRHIVLPEGTDDRILRAADSIIARNIVDLTLLGNEKKIKARILELGLDMTNIQIIDPHNSPLTAKYGEAFYELRKSKGTTPEEAKLAVLDVSYFGTMMVYMGDADGMVSGAVHSTAETIRPGLQIIKTKPGVSIVSSVFLMCLEDRVVAYGDCAVNPDPTAEELANIAISSAETGYTFGIDPRVAMLSYSTGDSGTGADVDKVRKATEIARKMRPDLKIEGPIQYDAAVSKAVAATKMPDSEVAGNATIFVFPDLNTGNNTYKAVQRETGAIAIGPILQGMNKPVNDLSRGCTIPDIINTVIITAIQSQTQE